MSARMEPRQTRGLSPRVEGDSSRREVRAWGAGECGDPRGREDTGALNATRTDSDSIQWAGRSCPRGRGAEGGHCSRTGPGASVMGVSFLLQPPSSLPFFSTSTRSPKETSSGKSGKKRRKEGVCEGVNGIDRLNMLPAPEPEEKGKQVCWSSGPHRVLPYCVNGSAIQLFSPKVIIGSSLVYIPFSLFICIDSIYV